MNQLKLNYIYNGDCLSILKTFPDESVDCIITSPPYYGLRDYGVEGQIGLEKTLDEYLSKMLSITAELKRVLKKTGTMWWNHGDSYSGSGAGTWKNPPDKINCKEVYTMPYDSNPRKRDDMSKCLMLQAHRLVIRMIDEQGWILRNTIIWHKPNCMPSSVKDRFTVDYEPVFFFSKSKKYWFETQYEAQSDTPATQARYKYGWKDKESYNYKNTGENMENPTKAYMGEMILPQGRNKRCVWKIPTAPFKGSHFAVFPEKLIEPMVKAGCPEFICEKCGVAREKIYQDTGKMIGQGGYGSKTAEHIKVSPTSSLLTKKVKEKREIGYTTCSCPNPTYKAGIVLDPFMGSGTTALVAMKQGKNYVGIELNKDYIKIANKRLEQQRLI